MQISLESIVQREDSYQLFLDSFRNSQTQRKYKTTLFRFLNSIPKEILEKYNLRYTIIKDCRIGLSIQGALDSMFLVLKNEVKHETIRKQTIEMLEENLMKLEDTPASIRNCLIDANNLIEGAVIDKANTHKGTLGAALSKCPNDMFAHESLKQALTNLYKFYSDQPNTRHAGVSVKSGILSRILKPKSTKPGTLRDLKTSDAILSTALAVSFASFIRTKDDGKSVIDGEI